MSRANARLERLIAQQIELGVSGVRLGISYEARAQTAIWSDDELAFALYSAKAADAYLGTAGSPVSARYQRLQSEAKRRGFASANAPTAIASSHASSDRMRLRSLDANTLVSQAMSTAHAIDARACRALELICSNRSASGGHLYLRRGQALSLIASQNAGLATDALLAHARDCGRRTVEQYDALTSIVTHTQTEPSQRRALAEVRGVKYELLPLTRFVEGEFKLVGVVAVVAREANGLLFEQTQLLDAIAAHLDLEGTNDGAARR